MSDEHYLKKELYRLICENPSFFEFIQSGPVDGIWYWDLEHPEKDWTGPRFWEILGYDPEEKKHLSHEWQELIFPEDLPLAWDNFHKHCADPNHPYNQIVRYRHKNGSTVWIRSRGIAIRDKAGTPIRMLGAHNDLTKQKQAEEALRESEEKYRALYENAPLAYQSLDESGCFLDVNPAWLKTLGYDRDEVIGKCFSDFLPPDLIPHFEKNFPEFKRRGYIHDVQFKIRHKNGTYRDVSFEGCIGYRPDGGFRQTYCVFQDITERKQAEKALRKSEEKFRSLAENSTDCVMRYDQQCRHLYINPAGLRVAGMTAADLIGKTYRESGFPEDLCRLWENGIRQVFKTADCFQIEFEFNGADGSVFLELRLSPEFDTEGKVCSVLGVSRDITERKKAEEALRDREEKYRSLFNNAEVGIFRSRFDGSEVLEVNRKFLDIVGMTMEETIGNPSVDLWADPKEREEMLKRLNADGCALEFEYKMLNRRQGDIRNCLTSLRLYREQGVLEGSILDITERVRAEEALRESEEKFRNFADQSFVGINLIQDGIFKYVNPKFSEIFGYTVEQCLENMSFHQLVHPEDLPTVQENVHKRLFGESKTVHYGFRGVRKDNKIVHLEIFGSSTLFNGKPAVIGTILDVTERIRAEEALRNSESKLNSLLETVPIPVFWKDKDGRYLKVNKAFEDFFGKNRKQVIGMTAFDISPPEQAKVYHASDVELFKKGGIQIYDTQVQNSNGALFDVISYKAPLVDVHGSINGLVGVFLDITERKRAEENLRRYELIVSSTEDMLALLDKNLVYFAVNAAFLKAFGKSYDQVIGKTARDVYGEELFQTVVRARAECCLTGKTLRHQNWFDYPTLGRRYVDVVYSPYLRPDGGVEGIVLTVRDITEYQNLQAQLLQAQKMESVGRLAGGVAHDYNNMLSIIMGYGELAKEKVAPGDPLHADLTEILSAAKRSADITRQLLAFSRQQTVSPKVLDINDTVESMLKMLRRLIGEDIDLAWLPEMSVWQVKIDPSQVDQILVNLCVNARDAIVDVGKVSIETQNMNLDKDYCADNPGAVPGEYVMLAVSDNGCGIAPEAMDKIFEPFFTTKGLGKGTGLGLATVYGIVKQNNGFIKAYSEPGKGTTIKVYLNRHMG